MMATSNHRKKIVSGVICLLTVFFWYLPVHATEDSFVVENIAVQSEAKTQELAREQALASGKIEGLLQLKKRLSLTLEDQEILSFTEEEIAEFLHGYEIKSEQWNGQVYEATYTFFYNPERVRKNALLQADAGQEETIISPSHAVRLVFEFSTLDEWVSLRRHIKNIPDVEGMDVEVLSTQKASVIIYTEKDASDIQKHLEKYGMEIMDTLEKNGEKAT